MRRSSLVRLYPSRWRRRYEAEFRALLDEEPLSPRLIVDVVAGAFLARVEPYPKSAQEDRRMTSRRLETTAAFAALLLALPAVVLLTSAVVRVMQPVQYEPAHTADAIVTWFATLQTGGVVLVVCPLLALVSGTLAVWGRLAEDGDLRADVGLFLAVSGRLLRRPALVAGAIAVLGSAAVLAFMVDRVIAG